MRTAKDEQRLYINWHTKTNLGGLKEFIQFTLRSSEGGYAQKDAKNSILLPRTISKMYF